jgi:ketosteroid isomerase-like protein
MENRGDSGVVAVVIAVALILLLLLAGGGGGYYLLTRQPTAMAMEAERAMVAEAMLAAERAHVEASLKMAKDQATEQIPGAVESILHAQEEAWNQGDIDRFMEYYWKSDDLTFSSEGKTTRGWTATMARYKEKYPTKERMGRLKLTDLEITALGDSAALVLGKWSVEREGGPLSGNFSLVVSKFDDRWLIVHDHTSRKPE